MAFNPFKFFTTAGSGYDAVKEKNRRQAPTGILRSEDSELKPEARRKLVSGLRDLHRNFSLAAWAVRRHLDYVSTFNFQCRSGNPELDQQVEGLMRWWTQPNNCDVTGRFSLSKLIRMAEMRRTVDNDVFLVKLSDGRLQAVEGDRVRTPPGGLTEAPDLIHGVQLDRFGKPTRYCICKRGPASDIGSQDSIFTFERFVDAVNCYHFGYFDRFDQVRGVSPLAAAVNTMRDTYEGFDYALAKMKISQMFGLVFFRQKSDEIGVVTAPETDDDADTDTDNGQYKVDFGRGPVLLDLDPGDDAKFLESNQPSTEFQNFSQIMISVALKALDIPYSFYAENFTNYSGSRQALLQYELSAKIKRADVQALLDHITAWRLSLFIADGVLKADLRDISWNWIPAGISWIDPLKEVNANIQAIGAGLESRTRILREQGIDFFDVANELEAEQKYLSERGLPFVAAPAHITINEQANAV